MKEGAHPMGDAHPIGDAHPMGDAQHGDSASTSLDHDRTGSMCAVCWWSQYGK